MDRKRNKENHNNLMTMQVITKSFKVKKSLFSSPKATENITKEESPLFSNSSNVKDEDESPYALFQVHKKRRAVRVGWKQPSKVMDDTPLKRDSIPGTPSEKMDTAAACTETSTSITLAIQKSLADGDLIGDFSKPCCLPTIKGSHPDLKTITPETVADLLQGKESQAFSIIDCRYPYEFQGGHIKNAINLYHKEDAEQDFFGSCAAEKMNKNDLFIFYCEFSSQRAPSMIRFVRNRDRDLNEYPVLYYPELYLLEGGYKAFHQSFKELCEPQEYKTMLDKSFSKEFVFYRALCKSWSMKSKRGEKARSALNFESPVPTTPQQ